MSHRPTRPAAGHKIHAYLLRNVVITRPDYYQRELITRFDQVWSTDITYVPMCHGFVYLVTVMDWYSRYVLSWRLPNTIDSGFCLETLAEALCHDRPEIYNSDHGCQFTAVAFTSRLESCAIAISMDGRGRAFDNVFVERLWRSVKYEEVYLQNYASAWEAEDSLTGYFHFYCQERVHQSLG